MYYEDRTITALGATLTIRTWFAPATATSGPRFCYCEVIG